MKFHYRLAWVSALAIARLLLGFRRHGSDRIPHAGPVVIASNHISYLDPILVGIGCPREVHFLAKEELFRNPLLRALITAHNALPVRRGILDRRGLKMASDVLERGDALLMFPEGTRSLTGELRAPLPGVGFLASSQDAPVVPAFITGSNAPGRAFLRKNRVQVAFGEPIQAEGARSSDDYRAFAERIMDEIRRLKDEMEGE